MAIIGIVFGIVVIMAICEGIDKVVKHFEERNLKPVELTFPAEWTKR